MICYWRNLVDLNLGNNETMRTLLFQTDICIIFLSNCWLNYFLLVLPLSRILSLLINVKRCWWTCCVLHSAVCLRLRCFYLCLNVLYIIVVPAYTLFQAEFWKKLAVATTSTWNIVLWFILVNCLRSLNCLIGNIKHLLSWLENYVLFEVLTMDHNSTTFGLSRLPSTLLIIFFFVMKLRLRWLS